MAAYTDKGPRKESNQDSACALVARTDYGDTALVSVCDGVGGLASGELASASVVCWLTQWFESDYPALLARCGRDAMALMDQVQAAWEAGLFKLNDTLRGYGRDHGTQLGTTCTAILLFGEHYLIAHIGDTRVYRFSSGRMEILTFDQTWVAQEVARGNIAPEKARSHPKRNVILQSVGTQSELQPVFGRGTYQIGDTFVVCCDGFRNELFDDELVEAFGSLQSSDDRAIHDEIARIVRLVLGRGEKDNVTAVACSVQPDGDYGPQLSFEDEDPTVRFNDPNDPKTTILAQVDGGARAGGAA